MGVMRATDQVTIVEGGIGDTTELEAKVEELNNNLTANSQPFKYAYQDGKYGYIAKVEGADTFFPFSKFDYSTVPIIAISYSNTINVSKGHTYIMAVKVFGNEPYIVSGATLLRNCGYVRAKDYSFFDACRVYLYVVEATSSAITFYCQNGYEELNCIIGVDITDSI